MQPRSRFSGTVWKREINKRFNRARRSYYLRSWADLPQELLDVISDNLNIVDYMSFGRVCRSWRLFYSESKQRFMASQSPLIVDVTTRAKRYCYFYDITSRIRYKTKLPKYICNFKFCVGVSSGYLVFMHNCSSSYIWLINPVTGHQVEFPPMIEPIYIYIKDSYDSNIFRTIFASIGSQEQDFLIVILSKRGENLQFCLSKDNRWKIYSYFVKSWRILDIIVFDGRIFALTNDSRIGIFNVRSSDLMFLKLKFAPRLVSHCIRLVASDDQLLVVDYPEVYRIDLSKMEWVKVNNLGEQALFLGMGDMMCNKLINPTKWGGQSNSIYYIIFSFGTFTLYSLNGDKPPKKIAVNVNQSWYSSSKIFSWYFLQQSSGIDNVIDD